MRADPIDTIAESLGATESMRGWLEELAVLQPAEELTLPSDRAAQAQLIRLGVATLDRSEMLAARPTPAGSPHLWWLLERAHRQLLDAMGRIEPMLSWPDLSPALGPAGFYLHPWTLLSALSSVRAFHRRRGVSDEVSWATLADLGRHMALCRMRLGRGGLAEGSWLTVHFRGVLYQLGRLQFERTRMPLERLRDVLPGATKQLPALSVHIPASGPMSPQLCDDSFARAPEFFARHFPEDDYPYAICTSWLLDAQLAEYLPEDSNIMRFQRRFQLAPQDERHPASHDDLEVLDFVFRRGRSPLGVAELDRLPQDTTLRRAIVAHLRAGRHWYFRLGWCALR
jgi:hypothetical protein